MRIPTSILTAIAVALLVSSTHAQERATPASKDQADESIKKVKELQKERIATLKKQVDALTEMVLLPRTRGDYYGEALEATLLLLQAELEVTEKGTDRIALYQKAIARLKQYEEVAKAGLAAGRNSEMPVLRIKARRLEVEIQLEQAKMKVAKSGVALPPPPKPGTAQPPPPNMIPPRPPE